MLPSTRVRSLCPRVIGANGSLTGYAGGLDKKIRLLTLEGVDAAAFSAP